MRSPQPTFYNDFCLRTTSYRYEPVRSAPTLLFCTFADSLRFVCLGAHISAAGTGSYQYEWVRTGTNVLTAAYVLQ